MTILLPTTKIIVIGSFKTYYPMVKLCFQVLLIYSVTYYLSSCGDVFCSKQLTFELPLALTPVQNEYKIGDTIVMSSKFSKNMIDAVTNEKNRIEQYDFGAEMLIQKIDENPAKPANTIFTLQAEIGKLISRNYNTSDTNIGVVHKLVYEETTNEYIITYKLIPKQKGLFLIAFFSTQRVGANDDVGLLKNCRSSVNFLRFNLNKRIDTHYEFSQKSPADDIQKVTKEEFDRLGYYTFYVK